MQNKVCLWSKLNASSAYGYYLKKKFPSLGTLPFYKLEKVLCNKRILKDVAKLSPHHQTSNVEAFHSVTLCFAPKNVVFPFLGMLCR